MSKAIISFSSAAKKLNGKVRLPSSKSISNRVLMIRSLCDQHFTIHNISDAKDTSTLSDALSIINNQEAVQTIDVQDAGTAFRFLTAFLSCRSSQQFILTGSERMKKRPIAELVLALKEMGADISYIEEENYPPLLIKGKKLKGGRVSVNSNVSSQFVSALCLIAPVLQEGLILEMKNDPVSLSYIQMTLQLLSNFGIQYSLKNHLIHIPHQQYQAREFTVENDWSSASFLYAMAMLTDETHIELDFLQEDSIQGDSIIAQIGADFGIETSFSADRVIIKKGYRHSDDVEKMYNLSAFPDLAIPLIVACAIRYPNVTFTGLNHLQYKESDRLLALKNELRKVNISLIYEKDVLRFDNTDYSPSNDLISFDTYNDHRIAMALSILALEGFSVQFDDTICIQKSFPGFVQVLQNMGFASRK